MAKQLTSYFISLVQDACLKAFWRKNTLASFLRNNHISDKFINPLFCGETKAKVLSSIFDSLSRNQTEQHQMVIINIARELSAMESFPDLQGWEESKSKIDVATKAVAALRIQYEKLCATFVDTGDAEARRLAKEKRDNSASYETRFSEFSERLNRIAANAGRQNAGYDFEKWLYDFSVFNDLEVRKPYRDPTGRQIDGALTIGGETMLVEAKCTTVLTNVRDIDSFRAKIETKADNTLGLMVSMAGFQPGAIQAASQGRTPFILVDGQHLFNIVMTRRMTFVELIERIKRHAAQTGCPYLPTGDF